MPTTTTTNNNKPQSEPNKRVTYTDTDNTRTQAQTHHSSTHPHTHTSIHTQTYTLSNFSPNEQRAAHRDKVRQAYSPCSNYSPPPTGCPRPHRSHCPTRVSIVIKMISQRQLLPVVVLPLLDVGPLLAHCITVGV